MTAEDLCKEFEGCKLYAYQDIAGVWTIGWGHTGHDVAENLTWTQQEADDALSADLARARQQLLEVSPEVTGGTLEALTDFVFNLGIGNYRTSTLCQQVNANDLEGAKQSILSWDHSGGKVIPGLLRRRQTEAALLGT